MTDLASRRHEAVTELIELERQAGIAFLDGKSFDATTVSDKRNELAAIEAAEVEARRRAEQQGEQDRVAEVARLRNEVSEELARHLGLVAAVRGHSEQLAADLVRMHASAKTLVTLASRLGDPSAAYAAAKGQIATTVSRLIGGDLSAVQSRSKYGDMGWASAFWGQSWDRHANKIKTAFAPIMGETE